MESRKPWTVRKKFSNFEEADVFRNMLIKTWQEEKTEGMQVKVKRTADGVFLIKTRLHPDFEPKKKTKKGKKKNGKSSKSNTKDSN